MKGRYALVLLIAVALVDVLVPYLVLRDVARFAGSYLFWCALTLAVIIYAAAVMRNWGKK